MPTPKQIGGDLMTDIKSLAIPFSLLIALNGMKLLRKKKDAKNQPHSKSTQKGGCGCTGSRKLGGGGKMIGGTVVNQELAKLANDIQTILSRYSAH